jgi:hypothetical protein
MEGRAGSKLEKESSPPTCLPERMTSRGLGRSYKSTVKVYFTSSKFGQSLNNPVN